ncbi:MAG: VOC family protein [Gammaproteobacteria bacterium]|nr:VOC family protein [Gammaproteobacteria bacterium]
MILAFAHPCLVVDDLEKARMFYEKMFGFKVISNEGWSDNPLVDGAIGSHHSSTRGYMMAGHNCFLELFEFDAPQQEADSPAHLGPHEQGIRHLAFYVDDCRAEYARCLELGGQALGMPAPEDSGINAVYLRDPCGNIIELCEVSWREEDPTRLPGISRLNEDNSHV